VEDKDKPGFGIAVFEFNEVFQLHTSTGNRINKHKVVLGKIGGKLLMRIPTWDEPPARSLLEP
jgi:hypothetical protein